MQIGVSQIRQAVERLRPWVHVTPVLTSRTLDARCGGSVFVKCENFQRVGAFKFRGAMNALLQLTDEEKKAGVVTHSSGNHAQAVALAGQLLGVPVCVVMPRTAPAIKKAATEGYGARVVPCEPTLAAREQTVAQQIAEHGYTLVHPYDDWRVIAGQGTVAWELLDQAGPLDMVVCPVGGGGLLSGTALTVKGRSPETRVIGVEPRNADDARRSLQSGSIQPSHDPRTIADGLRTSLGARPFAVISRQVDAIVTASEAEILDAMRFVWERFKIIIEPSSAVPVAALLRASNKPLPLTKGELEGVPGGFCPFNQEPPSIPPPKGGKAEMGDGLTGALDVRGKRVGVVISGGNVDLEPLFQALAAQWL